MCARQKVVELPKPAGLRSLLKALLGFLGVTQFARLLSRAREYARRPQAVRLGNATPF
jgi:hypothetical protein